MPFTFYILQSQQRQKFYYGHTGDSIAERLRKHNINHKGFTGVSPDWVVVYQEVFGTKSEAYAREREVKSWKSSKLVLALIAKQASKGIEHPDF